MSHARTPGLQAEHVALPSIGRWLQLATDRAVLPALASEVEAVEATGARMASEHRDRVAESAQLGGMLVVAMKNSATAAPASTLPLQAAMRPGALATRILLPRHPAQNSPSQ